MATLAADPKVRSYLEREIESKCNAKVARYQTLKKFEVLPGELSVEGGELTASMKLRRPQILEKHGVLVERMYSTAIQPAARA